MKTGLDLVKVGEVSYVELRGLTGYLRAEDLEYVVVAVDTEETAEAFLTGLFAKVEGVAIKRGVRDRLRLRLNREPSVVGWVVKFEVEVESMGREEVEMLEGVLEEVRGSVGVGVRLEQVGGGLKIYGWKVDLRVFGY